MRWWSGACRLLLPCVWRAWEGTGGEGAPETRGMLRSRPHPTRIMRENTPFEHFCSGARRYEGWHATRACFLRSKACQYAPLRTTPSTGRSAAASPPPHRRRWDFASHCAHPREIGNRRRERPAGASVSGALGRIALPLNAELAENFREVDRCAGRSSLGPFVRGRG
jgi:hypothetical protein